jgi:hypothetical protein
MAEKPPAFTVTDRRKFTADGDIREGAPAEETSAPQAPPPAAQVSANVAEAVHPAPGQFGANIAVHPAPGQFGANVAEAVHPAPGQFGARVVTMPAPPAPAPSAPAAPTTPPADLHDEVEGGEDVDEGDALPEPTAAESAEQQAAYRESSQQLDEMIRQSNPGMKAAGAVTIEHVLQSIYLSAVVAMGAAAEPGQKPRIDIVGARQSIDMLSVLEEKTRGNLNEKEQRLLQSMLFEVRMMFLEITNAIAHQAQNPPPIKK